MRSFRIETIAAALVLAACAGVGAQEADGVLVWPDSRESGTIAARPGGGRRPWKPEVVRTGSLRGERARAVADSVGRATGRRCEPNWIATLHQAPADPAYPQQWALHNTGQSAGGLAAGTPASDVGAEKAWALGPQGRGIVVAILDGGVEIGHPEFQGAWAANAAEAAGTPGVDDDGNGFVDDTLGWDFVGNDARPEDLEGHGTGVAGVVGARRDNGAGGAGLAPLAQILPVRVANAVGRARLADIVAGIDYAVARGASILNLSLGGLPYSIILDTTLRRAERAGVFWTAATGNQPVDLDLSANYPASLPTSGHLAVAACDNRAALSYYSSFGARTVALAAPGDAILVPALGHPDTIWRDGFSQGLAGWIAGGTRNPWGVEVRSGDSGVSESPAGAYSNAADSWIRTRQAIDATEGVGHVLVVELALAVAQAGTASTDILQVDASADSTFRTGVDTLGRLDQVDGTARMRFDLARMTGRRFFIRIRLLTNMSQTADGSWITSVAVLRKSTGPWAYQYGWGTSFAAPHVAAAAALLREAQPQASPDSLAAWIERSAAPSAGLAGKVRSGGRLDAYAALLAASGQAQGTVALQPGRSSAPPAARVLRRGGRIHLELPVAGDWTVEWFTPAGRRIGMSSGTASSAGMVEIAPAEVAFLRGVSVWRLRTAHGTAAGLLPR